MQNWWPEPTETIPDEPEPGGESGANFGVVIFVTDGGSPQPQPIRVLWGNTVGRLRPISRDGHGFVGWFDENNQLWDIETRTVQPGDVNADGFIILRSKWESVVTSVVITVNFDISPSTAAAPEPQLIAEGGYVVQPVIPTMAPADGRGFAGWYTAANLEYRWDFSLPVSNIDLTLYAKWEHDTRTVSFEPNGGTRPDGITELTHEFTVALSYGLIQDPGPVVKGGYSFAGWYVDPSFSGLPWNFAVKKVTDSDVPETNPLTLYARWVQNIYIVNFVITPSTATVPEPQTIPHGDKIVQPVSPPQLGDGRGFAGWYTVNGETHVNGWDIQYLWNFSFNTVSGNITLYARFVPQTRTVHFQPNGGLTMSNMEMPNRSVSINIASGRIINPGSLSKTGFSFGGWFTDPACTIEWNFTTDRITVPDTIIGLDPFYLYAKWTPNPLTVTFNAGGLITNPPSQIINHGERVERPVITFPDGKGLVGWYKDPSFNEIWNFDTDTVTINRTLYAQWDDIDFVVVFHLGDGSPGVILPAVVRQPEEQHGLYGQKVIEPFMSATDGTWSFYRWYPSRIPETDPSLINSGTTLDRDTFLADEPWDFETGVLVTDVTTAIDPMHRVLNLYARWVPPVPDMVWVPRGTFTMGDSSVSGSPAAYHAYPTRRVTVDGFYISRNQVTQIQYQNLMTGRISNVRPSNATQDSDQRPVERVSWFDAIYYCYWLTQTSSESNLHHVFNLPSGIVRAGDGGAQVPGTTIPGSISNATIEIETTNRRLNGFPNGFRLPTEAEWEFAARGGHGSPNNFMYSGSNNADVVAWYNATVTTQVVKATQPVGTKAPNALGIFDMSGNVSEWCWDWFVPYNNTIINSEVINPKGPANPLTSISAIPDAAQRVRRGGAWNNAVGNVRSVMRNSEPPANANWVVGFRVVRGPSEIW